MPNDSTLSIIVKLKDEASAGLAAISEKVKAAGSAVTSSLSGAGVAMDQFGTKLVFAGESIQRAGQKMSIGLTVPIVAIAAAATASATQFQEAMDKIESGAGASADEVKNLSKQFIDMAQNGAQQTPLQLAQGMYYVESAGYHTADAMSVLKAAMDGANVSGVDLNTVAQQLVTVMNATHTPTAEAENVMALLNATVGQGVMTMNDLIGAMSTGIIPKANSVGISINDVAAALDTMTRSGVPAQDGATRLGMTLSLIEAPTAKAAKALATIGLSSTQLADEMRTKGLIPALEDLETHLTHAGLTATGQAQLISEVFGGGRTSGAALLLLQNLDQMKKAFDGLAGGAAQFSGYVKQQGESTDAFLNRMKASVSASSIQIGNAIAPLEAVIFPKLAKAIEEVANWFTNLSPRVQNGIIMFLGLLAILGPVLIIVGSLTTAVGSIIRGLSYLVDGLGYASAAFKWFATAVTTGETGMSTFMIAAAPYLVVLAAIAAAVYLICDAYGKMKDEQAAAIASAGTALAEADKANATIAKLTDSTRIAKTKAAQAASIQASNASVAANTGGVGTAVLDFLRGNGSILQQFAAGGIVPGTPGQAVPILAHAGEKVIPVNQVGKESRNVNLHFNFNGAVSGDDGIRTIIMRTVQELNRGTALRAVAGV